MDQPAPASDLERRKQVKLRLRPDLEIAPHRYEGRTFFIVKDPVSLRYYRFKEQEHFLLHLMDGDHTLDDAQKEFEGHFRPERLTLEDLEQFGQQLLTVGLAHNESPQAGKQLYDRRKKRLRREWLATFTNILYIKIPIFDPDKLLTRMLPYLRWIFTTWFFAVSVTVMLAALGLVLTHFETFRDKLPAYHQFFTFKTIVNLWVALGVVKVIHEFGHGLSCKAFGGEVHEMGALFLCLSPCLYCNVSDAWTMPNKWHRIIISFAGIYVELIIAAIATFVWWNSTSHPFINNMSLSLMVVCSVSTVVFNGNPLMRYDGYYILADWLEIPNLRDRANRFLQKLVMEHCLGIEVQREPYMSLGRKWLFVLYAIISWIYRWVVTFAILYFLYMFLKPYKLGPISAMLAMAAGGSMVGWPLWRLAQGIHKRGRLPDMKSRRVNISLGVLVLVLVVFFFLPLPVSRVRQTGVVQLQPDAVVKVFVPYPGGILERLWVRNGETVAEGQVIARFHNLEQENELAQARTNYEVADVKVRALRDQAGKSNDAAERSRLEREQVQAEAERDRYLEQFRGLDAALKELHEIKAPRSGVVLGLPNVDEIGKYWDAEAKEQQAAPLCSIGDPSQLRVLVPVGPAEYHLLQSDLAHAQAGKPPRDLEVTVLIQGSGGHTCSGLLTYLPEADAKEVPAALTTRCGGPLAIKPSANPYVYVPLSQQWLVGVDFKNQELGRCPGTLAQVKIHCRWKTMAWWTWRTLSSTFDLGLM
jgi:putative peptide zinc metalloprotease protein